RMRFVPIKMQCKDAPITFREITETRQRTSFWGESNVRVKLECNGDNRTNDACANVIAKPRQSQQSSVPAPPAVAGGRGWRLLSVPPALAGGAHWRPDDATERWAGH